MKRLVNWCVPILALSALVPYSAIFYLCHRVICGEEWTAAALTVQVVLLIVQVGSLVILIIRDMIREGV